METPGLSPWILGCGQRNVTSLLLLVSRALTELAPVVHEAAIRRPRVHVSLGQRFYCGQDILELRAEVVDDRAQPVGILEPLPPELRDKALRSLGAFDKYET